MKKEGRVEAASRRYGSVETHRRHAKRRLVTTAGNPASQLRESRCLGKKRLDCAQRQEWQIVQSRLNLDDFMPWLAASVFR